MELSTSTWNRCLEHAALSDVGLRRANNQDALAVVLAGNQADFQQRGHFFMVADGMGAHAAGELASKMAVDLVSLVYRKRLDQSPPEAVLSAVLDANHQIHTRGLASPDFRGMGTTATALVLLPAGAMVAHVGDSRAYRLRGARLEQLTFDHSLVWEIRAAGQMPSAELPGYISKNIITRSLGPNAAVQVDMEGPHPLQAGDTFLLCSDGLSGQVKDDEIGMVLGCLPPTEAARALVDLANLRGGPDNITVIVVRVLGAQIAENTASEPSTRVCENVRPVHPLVWTVMGAAALAAVGLLAMGYALLALLAVFGAAVAPVAAMVQRYGAGDRRLEFDGRRFGRGPYVACECLPNADLLARLTDIIQQVRDVAVQENWSVDWAPFDAFLAEAASATQTDKPTDAARHYLHAITFLMAQLRDPQRASSDSGAL
jgi:PPM family protein phosphatase